MMPLTSVTKDAATLTLTVVGDYPVPQQRLWDAFATRANSSAFGDHPPFLPPSRVMISKLAVAPSTS